MRRVAIFAYSRKGCETARRTSAFFTDGEICRYTMQRFEQPDFKSIRQPADVFYGSLFQQMDALIFIGSCGIAVREIAPHVKDKKTDPAVVVIDELGKFVIPLLSGHIGGANQLAMRLSVYLKATPVVTTATDIRGRFSVDSWAADNGFILSNMSLAKAVSAEILEGDVPIMSAFPIVTAYPDGVVSGCSGEIGMYIGYQIQEPFTKTLRIIPQILHLGIGCRRGTEASAISEAVNRTLQEHKIDPKAIRSAASIDLKKEEQGLLQFCSNCGWPVSFYSASELSALKGDFTRSAFVSKITGVDNVCERAAMMHAARLIVKKTVYNGVTVAVAEENLEVHFG